MKIQKEKANVYDKASELYNDFLGIYFDEYDDKIEKKYDPTNLFLETYNYGPGLENEKLTDRTKK